MLKKTDFNGTWGLKGPVITLALLFPLVYFIAPDSIRQNPYLYSMPYGLVILFLIAFKKVTWKQLGLHSDHLKQNLMLGGWIGALILFSVPLLDLGIQASGMGQAELFAGAENRGPDGPDERISFIFYFGIMIGMTLADQLFFTGYLLQALFRKMNPALAVYLAGLIFTLAHYDFHLGMFLLGLIASSFYWITGSLAAPLIFQISCYTAGWLLTYHYPRVFTLLGFLF